MFKIDALFSAPSNPVKDPSLAPDALCVGREQINHDLLFRGRVVFDPVSAEATTDEAFDDTAFSTKPSETNDMAIFPPHCMSHY